MSATPSSSDNNAPGRMSLFDRLASLGNDILDVSKQRQTLLDDLATMKDAEQRMIQDEAQLTKSTQIATQKTESYYTKIKEMETDYQTIKDDLYRVTLARDSARHRRDDLKNHIAQERQAFFNESTDFQSTTKHLYLSAVSCGLEQACLQASIDVKGGLDNTSVYYHDCQELLLETIKADYDNLEDDPTTWTIDLEGEEEEMVKLYESYVANKALYDASNEQLIQAEAVKQTVAIRLKERRLQKKTLQCQMDKVFKDNEELELEILERQQLTEKVKQAKAALIRKKSIQNPYTQKKHKSGQSMMGVTPSPVPFRQGRNTHSFDNKGCHDGSTSHRQSQIQNIVLGIRNNQASPRDADDTDRDGRARRDKQFGSNLYVHGGYTSTTTPAEPVFEDDDDDDDGLLSFVAFAKNKSV